MEWIMRMRLSLGYTELRLHIYACCIDFSRPEEDHINEWRAKVAWRSQIALLQA
jgi:hypothetical protein